MRPRRNVVASGGKVGRGSRTPMRWLCVLLLAGSACTKATPEQLLVRIAEAHEAYELERFYDASRQFIARYPEHEERDRIRYEAAEQMVATTLLMPRSALAVEARMMLDVASKEARTPERRFDAALLLLKFTPNIDAEVEARAVIREFEDQVGVADVYFWLVTRLVGEGKTKQASLAASELLEKYPKIEQRKTYAAIARRGRLLGAAPPFDEATLNQIGDRMSGRVVLIDFWATWCAPCVAALPRIVRYHHENADRGFEVIGVSLDEDDGQYEAFMAANETAGVQLRTVGDDGIDEAFGVQTLPSYVIVDRDQKVREIELDGEALFEALNRYLAQPHKKR